VRGTLTGATSGAGAFARAAGADFAATEAGAAVFLSAPDEAGAAIWAAGVGGVTFLDDFFMSIRWSIVVRFEPKFPVQNHESSCEANPQAG
jgi:hypothetical protein